LLLGQDHGTLVYQTSVYAGGANAVREPALAEQGKVLLAWR